MSKEFGLRVLNLLKEKNITQKKLAAELELTDASLSRYLAGDREPCADVVVKIATYLNTSTDYLLLGKSVEEQAKDLSSAVSHNQEGNKNVAVSFAIIAGLILLALGLGILSDKEKQDLGDMLKDKEKGGE